jgi:two-component sensor histidine kinase
MMDENLQILKSLSCPFEYSYFAYVWDFEDDGRNEFIIYSNDDEKMIIYNNQLEQIIQIPFRMEGTKMDFSRILEKGKEPLTFIRTSGDAYSMIINKNKYFYFSFFVYPLVYSIFLFFIHLIKRITTKQVEQREKIKQKLLSLQLQVIKLQLDPHFTFNILNSVSSQIYRDNRNEAYDYLNKFTRLLRSLLKDTDSIYRSLEEEINFVNNYLELEKIRFSRFDYKFEIDESLKKHKIPKMVLQTYAENAIKHGLLPLKGSGFLYIGAKKDQEFLKLTIEDNGIGRSAASDKSTSTGRGLNIADEFNILLNQINKKPIRSVITDLINPSGEAAGTRVEIWVPLNLEFAPKD